ncbi:MAG: transglycosylase domain-containing protein, partial [Nocardioidaceae bacterium]
MSNNQPSRPRGSGRKSSSGAKPVGSGRKGKVKMRDVAGWAKVRHAGKKFAKWLLILTGVGVAAGAIAIYVAYQMIDIPDPNSDFQAQTSTVYYADGKHVLGQFALQNRHSVQLSKVPKRVQDSFISAENRSFRSDSGIDPKGIVRAAWNNLTSDSTQGASTITQQYVKILYLSQERTWSRKIKEAFLSVKVDNRLSKDQILEGYLNTIYFGRGAYGIDAAAHAYFDADAKDLNVRQGAVLASVLNSPSNLDPGVSKSNRPALLDRYRYVLDGLVDLGDLTQARADKLARHLPRFPKIKQTNKYGGQKGYMLHMVHDALVRNGFSEQEINGGGLKIVTSFSWKDMRAARKAVRSIRPPGHKDLHIALASVEPGTGALRAMIGGRNYITSQLNWAYHGGQPGSTFKAYALAAGLKDGFTLDDTFDGNSPFTLPNGETVHNEGENSGVSNGFSYGYVSFL